MYYAAGQHRMFDERRGIVDSFSEYLVSVTGAALVCCGIMCLSSKSTQDNTIIRLICGVFLLITIVHPVLQLKVTLPHDFIESLQTDTDDIIDRGADAFTASNKMHITDQLEAYVQQKLNTLNCDLEVDFTLQDEFPHTPTKIQLTGIVSPYMKSYISKWLHTELGIKPEAQQWIG